MPRHAVTIPLARAGLPRFSISQPRSASAPEEFAAEELRRHLLAMCGTGPQLRNEERARGTDSGCTLFINDAAAAESAGIDVTGLQLNPESFHLETRGGNLYLLGGGPRGVLYGVYDLLESLGCRWFTPTSQHIPQKPDLALPALKRTGRPAFEFRDSWAWDGRDPLWWLRNRLNGWYTPIPGAWGGHMDYGLFVHTFHTLLPPDSYFAEHPEYFSLTGGQRRKESAQICLSHPDVLRLVTQNVLEHMRKNPQARLFSVSQNDCAGYCECPECQRIAEEEGSQSGPLLRFVNAVAAETVKHFPDNLIDTLAYQYTLDAPTHVRPHRNVRVRLCSICCCQGHGYGTCDHPESRRFLRALEAWSTITSQIYIWHYCTNFAHYPMPMADFDEINANLQLYKRKGVYGVFMQGMGQEGGGGESMALRIYVLSKLLWNPDQPVWPLIREFLQGVCGPAAAGVESYMQAFHRRVRQDRNLHPSLYDPPSHPLFNAATLAAAEKGLATARRAAQTPQAKLYVDMLQNGIDYARIWQTGTVFRLRGNRYSGDAKPADLKRLQAMVKTWKQAGVLTLQEGQPFELSLLKFSQRLSPHKVEWLQAGHQRVAVVPDLGGRLLEWHVAGRQWLMPADPENLWLLYPMNEGYSELVSYGMYHAIGWMEPYRVTRRSATAITLETELTGNMRLRRTYALTKEQLTITSTLSNRGNQAKRVQWGPGLHLQPAVALLEGAMLSFRTVAGEMVALPWADMPEGLGSSRVYEEQKRPDGELVAEFADGTRLTWSFDAELVQKAILGRASPKRLLGLDLRTDYRDLPPGKSLSATQRVAFG